MYVSVGKSLINGRKEEDDGDTEGQRVEKKSKGLLPHFPFNMLQLFDSPVV